MEEEREIGLCRNFFAAKKRKNCLVELWQGMILKNLGRKEQRQVYTVTIVTLNCKSLSMERWEGGSAFIPWDEIRE